MGAPLAWERNSDGTCAELAAGGPGRIAHAGALLKQLAIAKMLEVSLVSAEFGEVPAVYEPEVWAFVDRGADAELAAAYRLAFPPDEGEELPALCVRRAVWSREEDYAAFEAAADKREYLLGEGQVRSRILFLTEDGSARARSAMDAIRQALARGISWHQEVRTSVAWQELKCFVSDGSGELLVSYSLYERRCCEIESWLPGWLETLSSLDYDGGVKPDRGSRISYRLALEDRLRQYGISSLGSR